MKVACVGGGPGGLYFAISMKLRNPAHDITVFERNRPGDTFGWGVVFSDQTMEHLQANDSASAQIMIDELAHWDDIEVHIADGDRKVTTRSGGHGFIGIGRKRLLNILQDRARELGVTLMFETEVEPDDAFLASYDLVIAADGLNSKLRRRFERQFEPDIDVKRNKFVWLGTHQHFDAFNFIFANTEHGWIWAHTYQFDKDTATFIVECSPEVYDRFGFGEMSQEETCRTCERIFADHLGGHELMTNASHIRGSAWINFPRVVCANWSHQNVVLLGDAAHTAHFSIGSGTKLALEDAIKLAEVMNRPGLDVAAALKEYQEERHLEVVKLQNAARNSTEWFENLDRYLKMDPLQFTYTLLTRSQRVSHENLRLRDPAWLAELEAAGLALVGAREGAALVPEELGFQELARHGRAVDLHEGGAAARRVRVDGARHQLLAHAGLAADQHGDVRPRGLLDDGLDLAHLRAREQRQLALQPVAVVVGGRRRRRGVAARPAGHAADDRLEVFRGVRPAQEVVGARLDGFHDLRGVPVVGDHDHRARGGELLRTAEEVDAGDAGQADRDHREGEPARAGDQLERLLAGRGGERRVAPRGELRDHAAPLVGVVVDDEDLPAGEGGGVRRRGVEAGGLHRESFFHRVYVVTARGVPGPFSAEFARGCCARAAGLTCRGHTLGDHMPDRGKGLTTGIIRVAFRRGRTSRCRRGSAGRSGARGA